MVADQPETARARADIRSPKLFTGWMHFTLPVLIVAGLIALIVALRPSPPSAPVGSVDEADPAQVSAIQETWGIRIVNVAVTAGGGLIDLRFQVIDPDKALGLLNPDGFPALVDAASGQVLDKGGAHGGHAKGFKAGRTYYFLYQNNGGALRAGSRVTVRIGNVSLENVLVR
jgi:hypothetical protein